MIIVLSIVIYILGGILTSRIIRNSFLTKEYHNSLSYINTHRNTSESKIQYLETPEEAALRCAKDALEDSDTYMFMVSIGGWFWPVTVFIYVLHLVGDLTIWCLGGFNFISSGAEREVAAATKTLEKQATLERQQQQIKIERAKLREIANSLGMSTEGLEDEL